MGLRDFFKAKREKKFGSGFKAADTTMSDEEIAANWVVCQKCGATIHKTDYAQNQNICPHCDFHGRINVTERIDQLIDQGTFTEFAAEIAPADPLNFADNKPYTDRLISAQKKTGVKDAATIGYGDLNGIKVVLAVMNFDYIGGSMGSVVGEKITLAIEKAIELKAPCIVVSSSGGARMHEGILSLMQMAKTSVALAELERARLPFISILTEPTYGGVAASFATLGDLLIAEPGARIGFAGKRVIEETIREKLPKDFQTAEYLLENGQIDLIIRRPEMKDRLAKIFRIHGLKSSSIKGQVNDPAKKAQKKKIIDKSNKVAA